MQHVVIQKSDARRRKREFLAQIERASEETLAVCLDNLDSANLSDFGAWQVAAIYRELETRA